MSFKKKIFSLLCRYSLLVILSLGGLWAFYLIFTPLTVYPFYFLISSFFAAVLKGTTVYVGSVPVEIIKACVAGSAYYLMLIFNLSTPGIKISKRLKMIFYAFFMFLIANVLRIFFLTILYINQSAFFDAFHKLSWYAGSVVLIIAIWFYQVKFYNIREIPFFSDLKFLYNSSYFGVKK